VEAEEVYFGCKREAVDALTDADAETRGKEGRRKKWIINFFLEE
jgi:hypothetical protein